MIQIIVKGMNLMCSFNRKFKFSACMTSPRRLRAGLQLEKNGRVVLVGARYVARDSDDC